MCFCESFQEKTTNAKTCLFPLWCKKVSSPGGFELATFGVDGSTPSGTPTAITWIDFYTKILIQPLPTQKTVHTLPYLIFRRRFRTKITKTTITDTKNGTYVTVLNLQTHVSDTNYKDNCFCTQITVYKLPYFYCRF